MVFSNLEYIFLRLVRRFIIPKWFLRHFTYLVPHYQASRGEHHPESIVESYASYCLQKTILLEQKKVLEIGIGSTNSTAYQMVARGAEACVGYEPLVPFHPKLDDKMLEMIARQNHQIPHELKARVGRVANLDEIEMRSIDVVFSNSVFEHVTYLDSLLHQLARILKEDGLMIHLIDYRDHFFKYPFHFLQFKESTWNKFLNPGDLPRYRISDHIQAFKRCGFTSEIMDQKEDLESFLKVKACLDDRFKKNEDAVNAVIFAAFLVKKNEKEDRHT